MGSNIGDRRGLVPSPPFSRFVSPLNWGGVCLAKFEDTMKFSLEKELENPAREVIWLICDALKDKGYDPVIYEALPDGLRQLMLTYF